VTATLLATDGTPFTDESVEWTFGSTQSSADKINQTSTTTNASGVATTTVTLACVAGERTVTATSAGVSGSGVLSITSIALPRTSTLPDNGPTVDLSIGTFLALFAVLAGGAIIVRRIVSGPR
jgi:hypothetical protein